MSSDFPVILNKVSSPHYVTPTLNRPRLLRWMERYAECRAIAVTAGAGYGKTTLLWQFERSADFPCYWYKLDQSDRDWTFVVTYLIESIRSRHEGFGGRTIRLLREMGGRGSSRPSVAAFLISEMHERLTERCTFIIDDWQFVEGVAEVRGLWNQLLRDSPPTCRFIFASRARPRLQFARFKTHGGFAQLQTDDLRFTDREIEQLFRETYRDPLQRSDILELERRTEGWAASLQLIEVSLRERSDSDERRGFIRAIAPSSDTDLFEFLAQEVMDQQPQQVRNFLVSTSILQQLTPELAERLAGLPNGAKALADLENRGLFTYRLDPDAERYRYHNLFRDFLERRLSAERGEAEVTGLHIHAASYFETHEQWPQAIHHYLRAGLQRQAARLIERYGEDVVAEGRVGTVDEWVAQIPIRSIRESAKLSLVYSETRRMRGEWGNALEALGGARRYFASRGDARMEALACLKLSSTYHDMGELSASGAVAAEGLRLAPDDATTTRLRLEGNAAVIAAYREGELASGARTCARLAARAHTVSLDHYAAVAHHNLGIMQRSLGSFDASANNLRRAATYWSGLSPSNPHADNADLVETLIAMGRLEEAVEVADAGVANTRHWPLPTATALYGRSAVDFYLGNSTRARATLSSIADGRDLGQLTVMSQLLLFDVLWHSGAPVGDLEELVELLHRCRSDARARAAIPLARARTDHRHGSCDGRCVSVMADIAWLEEHGFLLEATKAEVQLASLQLSHAAVSGRPLAVSAVRRAVERQFVRALKWPLRDLADRAPELAGEPEGARLIPTLVESDPDYWRPGAVACLSGLRGQARSEMLDSLVRTANRSTPGLLGQVPGTDVAAAHARIVHAQAPRLYARTFGPMGLFRGGLDGKPVLVDKRRVRTLLAVLLAHKDRALLRDQLLEILWPEADPNSALNSLNQSVFQLRHAIDPRYDGADSPQYVIATPDSVYLDDTLVRTDLDEFRRRSAAWMSPHDFDVRGAEAAIALVRGLYLDDLRYEDWLEPTRSAIHAEIRKRILNACELALRVAANDLSFGAATALIRLDPYDEAAHTVIARSLSAMGRRVAARDAVRSFVAKLKQELGEEPSPEFLALAARA